MSNGMITWTSTSEFKYLKKILRLTEDTYDDMREYYSPLKSVCEDDENNIYDYEGNECLILKVSISELNNKVERIFLDYLEERFGLA